ncbi:LysM peptidoglycan-binding domain-containing protein [Kiloniella sp. b19]|uniref:LysM peptidoglycan-binding domain-containing protein n=1 Tax=Kiloniella sp. GXU_MW_B19 TaxID=3141326 RepID=UPI0031D4DF7C
MLRLIFAILVILVVAVGGWLLVWQGGDSGEDRQSVSRDSSGNETASRVSPSSRFGASGESSEDDIAPAEESSDSSGNGSGEPQIDSPEKSGAVTSAEPGVEAEVVSQSVEPVTEDDGLPAFDVVRVDRTGEVVIAGRTRPGELVRIIDGDRIIGEIEADANGQWVFVLEGRLEPGTHELTLKSLSADGREDLSDQVAIVEVPERETEQEVLTVLVPQQQDGTPSRVVQKPGAEPEVIGEGESGEGVSSGDLAVDTVDYDEEGKAVIAGKAKSGDKVIAYLDNEFIGEGDVGPDGRWAIKPQKEIEEGLHQLRVDQVEGQDRVVERVELPFSRSPSIEVSENERVVKVQPGNSLWRISRRIYGEGGQYTVIYQRNQGQIRDPDLIYPGQIFVVPKQTGNTQ